MRGSTPKRGAEETGSRRVYDVLRNRILNLELQPGAEIDEAGLIAELGVSRTPIREALIRLSAEELVTLTPNRGAKVPVLDFAEVGELFDALEVVQRVATRWAALQRTPDHVSRLREAATRYEQATHDRDLDGMREWNFQYHKIIGEASGNRYFQRTNDILLFRSLRLAQLTLSEAPTAQFARDAYFDKVNREHEKIASYIDAQNEDAAENMIRDHIRQFRVRSLDVLGRNYAEHVKF
ncbi:GntR family transcriptional regulator [Acuticoccus kandeliae]|uniref:GntR family transcriptional regulator n=1 Tax=Acuticoccus kandeliae TaxID=2073160 RepID=UPI000D3E89BD|nr:GntR family transcriptional regulator [Acuticoccus kandeliae]